MKYYQVPAIFLILLFAGCAQQVAPTGGKKDEVPPKLLHSIPENKAVNFREKTIQLTFDEYVVIDNLMQKLIITPESENPYTPATKGQSVILKFKNNFADSTTYTLNFADGIKDFAERNPAQNLKLVFSTGPSIDSGRVYGTIVDIRTKKPVFDALVGLYQLTDSLNPEKNKPYYFSRTDSSGHFAIENTLLSRFALIALTDKNRNLLYNPKDEQIAFLDSVLSVNSDSGRVKLETFSSDLTPLRVQRTVPKTNDYTLSLNKGIDSLKITFPEGDSIPYLLENGVNLKFFNTSAQTDTIKAHITLWDSLGYSTDFEQKISFLPPRSKERQTEPFTIKTSGEKNKDITRSFSLQFEFNKPVGNRYPEHIKVIADTLPPLPSDSVHLSWNAFNTVLTVHSNTTAKDSIKLEFAKGAFISILSDTLNAQSFKYAILKPEAYGIIRGTISNPSNQPIIIELLDAQYKTVASTQRAPFTFSNVSPGTYFLRLIIDKNQNGRWDTGNYQRKIQPEPVLVYPNELKIKSNFEYEDNYFNLPELSGN